MKNEIDNILTLLSSCNDVESIGVAFEAHKDSCEGELTEAELDMVTAAGKADYERFKLYLFSKDLNK